MSKITQYPPNYRIEMDTPPPITTRKGITKLSLYRATVEFMDDHAFMEGLIIAACLGAFNLGVMYAIFHNVPNVGDAVAPLVAFILINIGIMAGALIIAAALLVVPSILYMSLFFQLPKADRTWRFKSEYTSEPRPEKRSRRIRKLELAGQGEG